MSALTESCLLTRLSVDRFPCTRSQLSQKLTQRFCLTGNSRPYTLGVKIDPHINSLMEKSSLKLSNKYFTCSFTTQCCCVCFLLLLHVLFHQKSFTFHHSHPHMAHSMWSISLTWKLTVASLCSKKRQLSVTHNHKATFCQTLNCTETLPVTFRTRMFIWHSPITYSCSQTQNTAYATTPTTRKELPLLSGTLTTLHDVQDCLQRTKRHKWNVTLTKQLFVSRFICLS